MPSFYLFRSLAWRGGARPPPSSSPPTLSQKSISCQPVAQSRPSKATRRLRIMQGSDGKSIPGARLPQVTCRSESEGTCAHVARDPNCENTLKNQQKGWSGGTNDTPSLGKTLNPKGG